MTAEESREQLPTIRVKYQGKVHNGFLRGRKLEHAIAWLPDADKEITVCWATVARLVTNNTILRA